MRFKVTVIGYYEVPAEKLESTYGTTDPAACARIDEANPVDDMLDIVDIDTYSIEPVQ